MTKPKRNKLIADSRVQGALVWRLLFYWTFAWLVVFMLVSLVAVLFSVAAEGVNIAAVLSKVAAHLWFPVIISIMVLPILVRDCLRISNKFAGPVLRFRRAMQQLANGEKAEPIKLRDGDFWQDLADDFNRMLARVQPEEVEAKQDEEELVASV
jgi:signal transduction histidine kinase